MVCGEEEGFINSDICADRAFTCDTHTHTHTHTHKGTHTDTHRDTDRYEKTIVCANMRYNSTYTN